MRTGRDQPGRSLIINPFISVLQVRAWLLTLNQGLEVDVRSNRHVPDGPGRKLHSEDQRVVVDLSLGHQHAITVVGS